LIGPARAWRWDKEETLTDFWDIAGEMMANDPRLVEGSIMGQSCLRFGEDFVAMPEDKSHRMIVKLDAARVQKLIDDGLAEPFAPAGKVFKEWAAVADSDHWRSLLEEAALKADG